MIDKLHCLDDKGLEWEWVCGKYDFHVQYDAEVGSWVLEQYKRRVRDPEKAHMDEAACESLQDALLFSLDPDR
ncbi:MAG: hypothetical protein ABIO65_11075 [Nitrospiria bacterium]